MRLIDVDALKKEHRMADRCEDCERNSRDCRYVYGYTLMDICSMLDDAPTVCGWISVKDKLPKISGHYLVSCVTNKTGRRWKVPVNAEWLTSRHEWYIETENCLATAAGVTVTHYMPLPEPPEEEV